MKRLVESSWKTMMISSRMLNFIRLYMQSQLSRSRSLLNSIWLIIARQQAGKNKNQHHKEMVTHRTTLATPRCKLTHAVAAVSNIMSLDNNNNLMEKNNQYWAKWQTHLFQTRHLKAKVTWCLANYNSSKNPLDKWRAQFHKRNQQQQLTQRRNGWEEFENKRFKINKNIKIIGIW